MKSLANLLFLCLILLFASPILYLGYVAISSNSEYFTHLQENRLIAEYFAGSLQIAFFTTLFSVIIGAGTAWLVSFQQFPFRKTLAWLLIMPLATPSYISAMLYSNMLEVAGIVQQLIRNYFGLEYGEYWFFNIRSTNGVIFILTFTLYPYVYMLMRSAFLMQSSHMLESATLLGCKRFALFWRIGIPIARPALIAGAALVMMESLSDFGVSSLYGVITLNTGIYRSWQSMMDNVAAARLALMLVLITVVLLSLEKHQRGVARFINYTALYHPLKPHSAKLLWRLMFCSICAIPVLIGFLIPLIALISWNFSHYDNFFDEYNLRSTYYSLVIAGSVALIASILGLFSAYSMRERNGYKVSKLRSLIISLASMSYAFSGSIIAVSVLLLVIMLQNNVAPDGVILVGSWIAILWGCSLRFFTIAHQAIGSGLKRISLELEESAMLLGANKWDRLWRVNFPLISGSFIVAILLIFIDTLKELPATILLRPFNVTPLSVRIYELAKDEMLAYAAPLALMLLLISSLAVIMVNRQLLRARPNF